MVESKVKEVLGGGSNMYFYGTVIGDIAIRSRGSSIVGLYFPRTYHKIVHCCKEETEVIAEGPRQLTEYLNGSRKKFTYSVGSSPPFSWIIYP